MPKRTIRAALVVAAACLPLSSALAGGIKAPPSALILARSKPQMPTAVPPPGYKGQHWTHPAGCLYSRAGRPGELIWFLASIPKGARCPEFIQQKVTDHVYRKPFMIDG